MPRILVVEDSPDARALVVRALDGRASLSLAASLEEARAALGRGRPDLVLLDVGLPDGDGFDLCRSLQADDRTRDVPVVFLTARDATCDKVDAFALGAEDYLAKPFDPDELRARVEARLRRSASLRERRDALEVDGLRLDLGLHRAFRTGDAPPAALDLTSHEFRLLYYLATRPGRTVTRDELVADVWSVEAVCERTVDTHMSNLRRKLGPLGRRIHTVRGVGYRFLRDEA